MLVADGNGLPISFELADANHHEVKLAVDTLETVRVPRRGRGRPKQRPKELPAAREEAPQAGASGEYRSGLRGALEGREDLRLAGQLPQAAGAPRTLSFCLPGTLLGRIHRHLFETYL
jgi:hypothetical protein